MIQIINDVESHHKLSHLSPSSLPDIDGPRDMVESTFLLPAATAAPAPVCPPYPWSAPKPHFSSRSWSRARLVRLRLLRSGIHKVYNMVGLNMVQTWFKSVIIYGLNMVEKFNTNGSNMVKKFNTWIKLLQKNPLCIRESP
jgi:hypothetical protein